MHIHRMFVNLYHHWRKVLSSNATQLPAFSCVRLAMIKKVHIWAATWQNQQSDCVPSEDSDQPVHPPSLISLRCALNEYLRTQAFFMRTAKTLIRQGRCPGWSESSLGAHTICWFCHVADHITLQNSSSFPLFPSEGTKLLFCFIWMQIMHISMEYFITDAISRHHIRYMNYFFPHRHYFHCCANNVKGVFETKFRITLHVIQIKLRFVLKWRW